MNGCLDDLVVIECGEGWPIALCGRILAEYGATVIKVESRAGDPLRRLEPLHEDGIGHAFHLVGAGKHSLFVDDPLTARLAREADVLLCGAPDDLPTALAAGIDRSDLLACHITPWGVGAGPDRRFSSDGVMQAAAGIMATTGHPDDPPRVSGAAVGDHLGALYAALAVLAALHARDRTGLGQRIDLANRDALLTFLLLWLPQYFMTGVAPTRKGNRHLSSVPWNTYPAADGTIMICTSTDEQWFRLATLMGRPDLGPGSDHATLPQRMTRVDEIDGLVGAWTRNQPIARIVDVLEKDGIPAAPILSVGDVLAGENARARATVVEVKDSKGGTVRVAGPVAKLSRTPCRVSAGATAPGSGRAYIESMLPRWEARPRPVPTGVALAGALADVRVIEAGVFGAGPFAGKLLAELGAQVLKLEAPAGDGMRRYQPPFGDTSYPFHLYNANKGSTVIDLKSAEGKRQAQALFGASDVLIENLGPGVMVRLGFGPDDLARLNPDLVSCSISGFGSEGPYSGRRAYDTTVQAMSGIMAVTGTPGRPTKIGVSIADMTGPVVACVSVCAALHWRHRHPSGGGQNVDLSMLDACVWMTQPLWPALWAGWPAQSSGEAHAAYVPYGSFGTADKAVFIGVETDEQWRTLASMIGGTFDPACDRAAGRLADRARLCERVARWCRTLPSAALVARLQRAGVPAAVVASVEDAMSDPSTADRDMIVTLADTSGRPVRLSGSPFRMSRTPGRILTAGPELGHPRPEVHDAVAPRPGSATRA